MNQMAAAGRDASRGRRAVVAGGVEGGLASSCRPRRQIHRAGNTAMAGDDGDRRLYETLGRIQATLEVNGRETERFRDELKDEVRAVAAAAEASRQQIHADLAALAGRVTTVEFNLRGVGLMAEDTRNRVSLVAPTVQEHEDIKNTASGVTIALKHMGKVIYLTGAAFLAMVGTTIAYIYHLIESSGGMHPK